MSTSPEGDIGFSYRKLKAGEVQILHLGALAGTLRGSAAAEFLAEVADCEHSTAQQLMARLTGNYKHGNERLAMSHPRNVR